MYRLTLNRVHDSVLIEEGGEQLSLHVDSDPMRMVAALTDAQSTLRGITEESAQEERTKAAVQFAAAMFGPDQARELMEFYHGDPACVIALCGKYFSQRLVKLIEKAQKKAK